MNIKIAQYTQEQLAHTPLSAIRIYSHTHNHPIVGRDFNTLHKAGEHTDIEILKALYIKHLKPEFDNQLSSTSYHQHSYIFYESVWSVWF